MRLASHRSAKALRHPKTIPKNLVERWFAFGPSLPASMEPEPLVRIAADVVFDHAGEERGVGDDIGFVACSTVVWSAVVRSGVAPAPHELKRGIEAQGIFAELVIPGGKSRHDGGVGAEGNAGQSAGGVGRDAEEIYEHALRWSHVGVHENAYDLAHAHRGEQAADEVVFADGAIAMHGAVAPDERVDVRIVERAHDDPHRMALQRMGKGGEFPSPEMAGEKENSLAAGEGLLVIFESTIDDDLGDILTRVAGKETDLGKLAAEGDIFSAKDAASIV